MKNPTGSKERRSAPDRRGKPSALGKYSLRSGQRKAVRRRSDKRRHIYVDVYSTRLWITLLLLMVLSLTDGYLTLVLIDSGLVYEANPIMAAYADFGSVSFIVMKTLMTTASLLLLCLFHGFPAARLSLFLSIVMYSLIIIFELQILYRHAPSW